MKKLFFLVALFVYLNGFAQTTNSVLSSGNWYKVSVNTNGIYRISYDDLLSYGIDVDNIDPENIALYGNGAGMLPESNSSAVYDDLQPVAIFVAGEQDGHFDPDDYILFYGEAPTVWDYDSENNLFSHQTNYYTGKTFYFLTVGDTPGKRIETEPSSNEPANDTITSYKVLICHENDSINPGKTGKEWLGETFNSAAVERTFHINTDGFNLMPGNHYLKVALANFDTEDFDYFSVALNNQTLLDSIKMPICGPALEFYRTYMQTTVFDHPSNNLDLQINYLPGNEHATGYLDYFELVLNVSPVFSGDMLNFVSMQNTGNGNVSYFSFEFPASRKYLWDVSNPLNPKNVDISVSGNNISFKLITDDIKKFCLWNGESFPEPVFEGVVENQNLHAMETPGMLIVTASQFSTAAETLAGFHRNNGMSVETADVNKIYNEFSSGKKDPFAIRNFVKYLYSNSGDENRLEYLLLLGKGSYDYKDRLENNTCFVPVIESDLSNNAVNSFASDDYYGIFNDNGTMDIAVGRLPVSNESEAADVVQKIIHYSGSPQCFGDWKNNFMIIADDGDNNLHLSRSEGYYDTLTGNISEAIIAKDYLDLYPIDSTTNPPTYPQLNEIINNSVNSGVFFVNFTGHGGKEALAAEHVVTANMIDDWENFDRLPVWIIASGDVIKNDEPEIHSIGEKLVLKNNGGSIAALGSTQANYASANYEINTYLIDYFSKPENRSTSTLGKMLLEAKNHSGSTDSFRKWNLLGDPALKIGFPKYDIVATEINGIDITAFSDTVKPGSQLTFSGYIADNNGSVVQDFNGTVLLKMIDMPYIKTTLANQTGSYPVDVLMQDSILSTATGEVTNGIFEITVTMPSFYHQETGPVKGSFYALSAEEDASGAVLNITYGSPVGIDDYNILSSANVYPTVFHDKITVAVPPSLRSDINLDIYDPLGRKIFSKHFSASAEVFSTEIPPGNRGMYILRLKTNRISKAFKLFRE